MVIGYMAISYIGIDYGYCYWLWVLTVDNWKLGMGIGY
jgi:hypothetical protein